MASRCNPLSPRIVKRPQECIGTESECCCGWCDRGLVGRAREVRGDRCGRLIFRSHPHGRPRDLVIVEVDASLVSDRLWLEDLSENLCHGSTGPGERFLVAIDGFLRPAGCKLTR